MKLVDFVGLNTKKLKFKDLLKSIILAYLIIFVIILIKLFIFKISKNEFLEIASNLSIKTTIIYGFVCLFQEIVIRGLLQRLLKKKTNSSIISILLSNIVFVVCHYNYRLTVIFGALFIGIINGYITDKDDNIYKSIFMHWIIGGLGYIFI